MQTRLGQIADKIIEYGWLAAAIFAPLFFNVYSSRVFEPDKISTLRSLVLVMALAWLIKALEGGVRAYRESPAETRMGRVQAAVGGAAERGMPGWMGWWRVPMLLPIAVYALAYLLSTLFSVTMDATLFGSYQRLQGTYSQYSYMLLGIMVIANLRTRAQLERLINFMLLTSVPVVMYAFVQATPLLGFKLDPLPWAGDTATRVASTMGNAIFVAAWLIMVVPFALYRLFNGVSAALTARRLAASESIENRVPSTDGGTTRDEGSALSVEKGRKTRGNSQLPATSSPVAHSQPPSSQSGRGSSRRVVIELPSYGWAVVASGLGIIFAMMFVFYMALKVMAGLPFPDASMWWVLPGAMLLFFIGCLLIEALGNLDDDHNVVSLYLPMTGIAVFITALIAMPFDWAIRRVDSAGGASSLVANVSFDGGRLLWVFFFTLLWGAISAYLYWLAGSERLTGSESSAVVRSSLNVGYGLLLAMLALAIYLTQSRGPWLGLGAGLLTFVVAMWLVGRQSRVRWMTRFGGAASAVALALVVFVGLLNIPGSPLQALGNLPLVGRGIERLSTLARTEDGTGKVRALIWEGATNLILSDPMRALIGWGPEAMYVAYSPFYPAELAQYELRNATPDRSHNVEFDQLVTMGVVGLLAYYFLVGAFFYYSMRLLRRVSTTRDRLLVIALISVMVAHFIEIQTGIQIASTWTYFYLIIGMMVAFGWNITRELRTESGEAAGYQPSVSTRTPAASTQKAEGRRERAGGNVPTSQRAESRKQKGDAPTRNPQSGERRRGSQAMQAARDYEEQKAFSNPGKLALYVVAGLLVWMVNFGLNLTWIGIPIDWPGVNSATVRADSEYKVGLQYDQARLWPESITLYRRAISLQPGQDYYYLFLGRSWLEFAKQVDQERAGTQIVERAGQSNPGWPDNGNWRVLYNVALDVPCEAASREYDSDAQREAERLCRLRQGEAVLKRAHNLNPLNADHYANLGRLYLYWADATGGKDPSKTKLAVESFEAATERTPGNAQLWDELAVAYARDGQFNKAIETLRFSQNEVDRTYARTPFLRGQLLQERASEVRNALTSGAPLPTGGETDYGKLVVGVGEAYSETIRLDPTQFVDGAHKARIESILSTSEPFTATNTTLPPETVRDVLTSTVTPALEQEAAEAEKSLANYLRTEGAYTGSEEIVPASTLQALWQNSNLSGPLAQGEGREWKDPNIPLIIRPAVASYGALGYIYQKTGRPERARDVYNRILVLDPNNTDAAEDLKAVSP